MFPLYDENRFRSRPFVTWGLIIVNALVFVWELNYTSWFTNEAALEAMLRNYGVTPFRFVEGNGSNALMTLITSMFLHSDFLHIIGNMVFLYIFGDNVEYKFGHAKFLILYLIFGFAGASAHILLSFIPGGDPFIPAIGASAAISGVLGAYVVYFPFAKVVTLIFFFFFVRLARVPAYAYIGFWFLLQFINGALDSAGTVGYGAHVGGFIAGFLVAGIARVTKVVSTELT